MTLRLEYCYKERPMVINQQGQFTLLELPCLIFDAADEEQALNYAYHNISKSRHNLPLERIELTSREAENIFTVTAFFGTDSGSSYGSGDNETTVSFDCSGGTMHVNHAISQRRVFGTLQAGTAVNWNGKLGDDMQVQGVDIPSAQLRETYSKTMSKSRLTTAFKRKVARLTGRVNSKPFKGWEAGEVMFLGASCSGSGSKLVVSFNFAIQENESSVEIAGIQAGKKQGWEYVWAINKSTINDNVPEAGVLGIYVAKVAQSADLNELGI